jgi:putative transposase
LSGTADQWRLFFEQGATNKRYPAKHLNGVCGAVSVQMATRQVVEHLDSWISNRANEFVEIVSHSSLPDWVRKALCDVSAQRAWFRRGNVHLREKDQKGHWRPTGDVIAAPERQLARHIMRHVMAQHRRPDLAHISPRLDARIASIAAPRTTKHAGLWASLKLPRRGRVDIPLLPSTTFAKRGGRLCPVVQLCTERDGSIGVRLVSDISKQCAALKASYVPQIDSIGIDFGLTTLLATDRGDLMGRGLFADLKRLDREITGIARHRQRIGDKPRISARYCRLVARVRGMLKTRINAALNRIITIHRPTTLRVERLNFQSPDLSRRMNRILSNCGRSVFKTKLADLQERFGVVAEEVPSPYTSQECSSCGYVDRRNRRSKSKFVCRFCGCTKHAGVNGACVINARRSRASDPGPVTPGAVLAGLVRRFCNPHFADWAGAARKLLQPPGFVLKQ